MTEPEYIRYLQSKISTQEQKEDYEYCQEIMDQIDAIQTKNIEKYIKLNFCIKILTKAKFFTKGMTYAQMAERITTYFGYESVFEYSFSSAETRCHISYVNPEGKDSIYQPKF